MLESSLKFSWRTISLVVATALIFSDYSIISLVIFVWLIANYLPDVSKSKLSRIVWVCIIFFSGLTILYDIAWVASKEITPTTILILLAITAWSLVLKVKPKQITKTPGKPYQWISLSSAIIVCVFVSLPIIRQPSYATLLRYAAKTGDDINHIGLIEADHQINGYLYNSTQAPARYIASNLGNYPQGWHIGGAFVQSQITKLQKTDSAKTRLLSFFIYKTFWLGLAVFVLSDLILLVAGIWSTILIDRIVSMVFLSGLALAVLLLVSLFGYGFQTFIGAITLVCAGILTAIYCIKNQISQNVSIVVLAVLTTASASIWLLTAPMVFIPALYFVIKDFRRFKPHLQNLKWRSIVVATAILSVSFQQIYVQLKYGAGSVGLNSGGVVPPIYLLGVIAIWILGSFLAWRKSSAKARIFLPITVAIFAEFIIIGIYQQFTVGGERYYGIKITFLAALIGLAIFLPIYFSWLFSSKLSGVVQNIVAVATLLILPFLLGLNIRTSAYPLKNSAPISLNTAQIILAIPRPEKNVAILTDSPAESYLATELSSSVWAYDNRTRQQLIDNMAASVASPGAWIAVNAYLSVPHHDLVVIR